MDALSHILIPYVLVPDNKFLAILICIKISYFDFIFNELRYKGASYSDWNPVFSFREKKTKQKKSILLFYITQSDVNIYGLKN